MRVLFALTGRNLRLYFRDPSAVLLSLLSSSILIVLYAVFLGKLQVDNLSIRIPNATAEDIHGFVNTWVFAGTTMITTLTTGLAALNVFVEDNFSGRFRDFLVSPVSRARLILGYLISSFIIAFMMSILIVICSQLFLLTQGQPLLSLQQVAVVLGYIALSAAAFSAISSFVVTFIGTSGAFSAFSTVVGTVIGFLAAAYIPQGTLPTGVVNVLNTMPFAQAAMLIREPFTANAIDRLADGSAEAKAAIEEFYGITISVGDFQISTFLAIVVLVAILVIFAVLGTIRISRKIR